MNTKTIFLIERIKSSRYGNPRFEITFTDKSKHKTAPDSAFSYGIAYSMEGKAVNIELDRWGNITRWEILQ